MDKTLVVHVEGGYLRADVSQDPFYPGIDIEFVPYNCVDGVTNPRILVEKPKDSNTLRALVWNDSKSEDYTDEIVFKPLSDIESIAHEIDAFGKEYDYYGYCDAIDDTNKYWTQLITYIANGDVQYLIDWLQEIVDEDTDDGYSAKAKSLMDKLLDYRKD